MMRCIAEKEAIANLRAQEYIVHGVGRRIGVLRHCLENIFSLFPPSLERPLESNDLYDVQINLQAFVFNLYGVFDNLAWAFLFRHSLECDVGSRRNVSLFNKKTQRFLPPTLRDYVTSKTMDLWHGEYLTGYRDALAHRIPLYVPPADWTKEDSERYVRLETEKLQCMRNKEWDRITEITEEQATIGAPSLRFLHSFSSEDASKSMLIHPQIVTDSMTVAEFGGLFLQHWGEYVSGGDHLISS